MERVPPRESEHAEPWERAEAFRSIIDRNDDLMAVVDPAGILVYVNQAAERVFGIGREECLGRSWFDFVHPDDRARTSAAFQTWCERRTTSSFTFENSLVSWDGSVRQLLWTITPCVAHD